MAPALFAASLFMLLVGMFLIAMIAVALFEARYPSRTYLVMFTISCVVELALSMLAWSMLTRNTDDRLDELYAVSILTMVFAAIGTLVGIVILTGTYNRPRT